MKEVKFISFVKAGRLAKGVSDGIKQLLAKAEGKRVVIKLSLYRKQRSLSQNAFYWKVMLDKVVEVFHLHGDVIDLDQAHYFAQTEILKRYKEVRGVKLPLTSTTKDTIAWETDNEIIRAWCAEQGIVCPFPNEINTL